MSIIKDDNGLIIGGEGVDGSAAWYRKLGGGLLIQGGPIPCGTTVVAEITFPVAFANADYIILKSSAVHNDGEDGGGQLSHNQAHFYARTATSAKTSQTNIYEKASWIAIGKAQ